MGQNFENCKEQSGRKGSPERLVFALEMLAKFATNKVEVQGRENLAKINEGKKVIIACSHISDMDMGMAAYALRNDFDLLITHQSVQTLFTEPGISLAMKMAGKDNFLPIDWRRSDDGKKGKFNPNNFVEIAKSAEKNEKTPLIAAHNPSKNWRLEKGGYGAVMLAQYEENSVILPVGVNVKSEKPVGMAESRIKTFKQKPEVEIVIGEPFELPKIEGIDELRLILDKIAKKLALTDTEKKSFAELHHALKEESNMLMERLAQCVPAEKRGVYRKETGEGKPKTRSKN